MTMVQEGTNTLLETTYDREHLLRETLKNGITTEYLYDDLHRPTLYGTSPLTYDTR